MRRRYRVPKQGLPVQVAAVSTRLQREHSRAHSSLEMRHLDTITTTRRLTVPLFTLACLITSGTSLVLSIISQNGLLLSGSPVESDPPKSLGRGFGEGCGINATRFIFWMNIRYLPRVALPKVPSASDLYLLYSADVLGKGSTKDTPYLACNLERKTPTRHSANLS